MSLQVQQHLRGTPSSDKEALETMDQAEELLDQDENQISHLDINRQVEY